MYVHTISPLVAISLANRNAEENDENDTKYSDTFFTHTHTLSLSLMHGRPETQTRTDVGIIRTQTPKIANDSVKSFWLPLDYIRTNYLYLVAFSIFSVFALCVM